MLQELNNSEALLMYAAGELPDDGRAELEQRLGTDAALRAELQQIQDSLQWLERGMATLDLADGNALVAQQSAVRRIGLAMRSEMARRASVPAPKATTKSASNPNLPWWAYASIGGGGNRGDLLELVGTSAGSENGSNAADAGGSS